MYPIFGEEETIFGYKNLDIDVSRRSSPPPAPLYASFGSPRPPFAQYRFASGSLAQYLKVSYDAKFPETATVKADDPEKTLYKFIPPDYLKDLDAFNKVLEKDAVEFKPLGTEIGAYRMKSEGASTGVANGSSAKGKGKGKSTGGPVLPERQWEVLGDGEGEDDEVVYEAYWSNWDTPGFKEYHRRMQIFVLLYIEGASYIDEEDGRWEFVTLYALLLSSPLFFLLTDLDLLRFERRKRGDSVTYHFAGYVSFYSFFCWPDTKRLRLACVTFPSFPTFSLFVTFLFPQPIRPPPSLPRSRPWL